MSDVMEPFVYKSGIEVPDDVVFVTVHHSVKILPFHVFELRLQLKEVALPEGLEEIGESAFAFCISLDRVNYPSTLIRIGHRAFYECRSLREVTLQKGLKEIGEEVFRNCLSLGRINCPSTLIRIGNYSFQNCRSLKEVDLPEGLKEIGAFAFIRCKSLQSINFPSTLIKIGDGALGCCPLKVVTLPEGLEEVGTYAFKQCEHMEHIDCPSTLIRIGARIFERCRSLAKVTLAGGIMTIEANATRICPSLERVRIPFKAFIIEVEPYRDSVSSDSDRDSGGNLESFTCRLVLSDNGTTPLTEAKQVIISPERLNYIRSPDLLELQRENAIATIMNDRGRTREENIEQVLALIKSRALIEVSTILELALWKNKMDETDDSNAGSRRECRVMCGADGIIPCVLSYL